MIPNVYANVVQATDGSDTTFEKACDINSIRDFIVNSVFPPDMSPRPLGKGTICSAPLTIWNRRPTTRETDLFDLPMASERNTPTKVFSLNANRRVNNDPPIAIESDEDDKGDDNIDDIPQDIPQDIPRETTNKRAREP